MKKLTLQNLAPYLPYGLKVICPTTSIYNVQGMFRDNFLIHHNSLVYFEKCKPILRSLYSLTKPITHKGETFVPLLCLAEMAFGKRDWENKGNYVQSGLMWFFYMDGSFFARTENGDKYFGIPNQLALFQKMYEMHFDLHNLIADGLAIDVETLTENPYK